MTTLRFLMNFLKNFENLFLRVGGHKMKKFVIHLLWSKKGEVIWLIKHNSRTILSDFLEILWEPAKILP